MAAVCGGAAAHRQPVSASLLLALVLAFLPTSTLAAYTELAPDKFFPSSTLSAWRYWPRQYNLSSLVDRALVKSFTVTSDTTIGDIDLHASCSESNFGYSITWQRANAPWSSYNPGVSVDSITISAPFSCDVYYFAVRVCDNEMRASFCYLTFMLLGISPRTLTTRSLSMQVMSAINITSTFSLSTETTYGWVHSTPVTFVAASTGTPLASSTQANVAACKLKCEENLNCGVWTLTGTTCKLFARGVYPGVYDHTATSGAITNRASSITKSSCTSYVCSKTGVESVCQTTFPAASAVAYKTFVGPTLLSSTALATDVPLTVTLKANAAEAASAKWNTPPPSTAETAAAGPLYVGFGALRVRCPCFSGYSGSATLLASSNPITIASNVVTSTWALPTHNTVVKMTITIKTAAGVAVPALSVMSCNGADCPGTAVVGTKPWRDFDTSMETQTAYTLPAWISVSRAHADAGLVFTVQITTPSGVEEWCTAAGYGSAGGESVARNSQFTLQMATTSNNCRWPKTRDGVTCRDTINYEIDSDSLFDARNVAYKNSFCVTGNYSVITPTNSITQSSAASSFCPNPQICSVVAANANYNFAAGQPMTAACVCTPRTDRCSVGSRCMYDGEVMGTVGSDVCKFCKPATSKTSLTFVAGGACDDQNLCTRVDKCTAGTCAGTPFQCLQLAHTGSARQNCEECDGDGCQKRASYAGCVKTLADGSRSCGCSISGVCYADGEADPANSCQWCDVLINTVGWSPAPARACDDGIACTYDDTCSSGVCVGTPYTCATTGLCMASNACDGDGGCAPTWKPATTVCRAGDIARCDFPWYCTGVNSYCQPAVESNVPQLSTGYFVRALRSTATSTPTSISGSIAADLWTTPNSFGLLPHNFSASCGALDFSMSLVIDDEALRTCDVSLLQRTDLVLASSGTVKSTIASPKAQQRFTTFSAAASSGGYVGYPSGRINLSPFEGKILRPIVQLTLFGGRSVLLCPPPFSITFQQPVAGTVVLVDASTGSPLSDNPHGYFVNAYSLAFSWSGFLPATPAASYGGDALSYTYAVGLTFGGVSISGGWVSAGVGTGSASTNPVTQPIPEGQFFVTVRATQRDTRYKQSTINVTVDRSPPLFSAVYDGIAPAQAQGAPLRAGQFFCLGASKTLQMRFAPATAVRAPISHYEVGFGERPGAVTIGSVVHIPHNDSISEYTYSYTAKDLLPGVVVYASVRAVTYAGTSTMRSSTGQLHDSLAVPAPQLMLPAFASLLTGSRLPLSWMVTENYCPLAGMDVWMSSSAAGDADLLPVQRLLDSHLTLSKFRSGSVAQLPSDLRGLRNGTEATRDLFV
ncbi:MAG: hypothetical protein EOO65_00435, partial [Methanosarcinales archaeon]